MRNKYFYLITVVMISCTIFSGCGKEKNSEKETISTFTEQTSTKETTESNTADEVITNSKTTDKSEETTTYKQEIHTTTNQQETTTKPKQQITTKKQETTKKPKETTIKKQDPTVNIVTTTPAPTKYNEHYGETYTVHNIETHPVDPGWDEEETTKDYSNSEICTDSHVKDYNEIAPVYEDQLISEIQYKTTYIRNWINYSLKNAPDAWLVEAIVLYLETHDPNTFNYIKIDNYNGDNWRRILAAEIWNGHDIFDWNFINEYYKIYNNLLWDCVYNDDFINITNIKFLDISSNEINFENNEDGTNITTLIKISFSSGGANYIAWFTQGGGFIPSTGDYNLIDIDKVN